MSNNTPNNSRLCDNDVCENSADSNRNRTNNTTASDRQMEISNHAEFMSSLISFLNVSHSYMSHVRSRSGRAPNCTNPVVMTNEEMQANMTDIVRKLEEKFEEFRRQGEHPTNVSNESSAQNSRLATIGSSQQSSAPRNQTAITINDSVMPEEERQRQIAEILGLIEEKYAEIRRLEDLRKNLCGEPSAGAARTGPSRNVSGLPSSSGSRGTSGFTSSAGSRSRTGQPSEFTQSGGSAFTTGGEFFSPNAASSGIARPQFPGAALSLSYHPSTASGTRSGSGGVSASAVSDRTYPTASGASRSRSSAPGANRTRSTCPSSAAFTPGGEYFSPSGTSSRIARPPFPGAALSLPSSYYPSTAYSGSGSLQVSTTVASRSRSSAPGANGTYVAAPGADRTYAAPPGANRTYVAAPGVNRTYVAPPGANRTYAAAPSANRTYNAPPCAPCSDESSSGANRTYNAGGTTGSSSGFSPPFASTRRGPPSSYQSDGSSNRYGEISYPVSGYTSVPTNVPSAFNETSLVQGCYTDCTATRQGAELLAQARPLAVNRTS